MIDIHNHSLPNMDDGARDTEMSIAMLEYSASQGVTEIVVTPHMNHPLNFEPIDQLAEDKVFQLQRELDKRDIPLRLYLGAECYIQQHQLKTISQLSFKTLNNTDYILVEFDRSIHFKEMDYALHELKLRGLKPILAHVEVYQCLREDYERIVQLRDQEYIIQCNASNLMSKEKNCRSQFAKQLIQEGLVDVIASDHHNMNSRPQMMGNAKEWLEKRKMPQEAERLMEVNPKAIIRNESITRIANKSKSKKGMNIPIIASLAILLILGSVVVYSMTGGKECQYTDSLTADNEGKEQVINESPSISGNHSQGLEEFEEVPHQDTDVAMESDDAAKDITEDSIQNEDQAPEQADENVLSQDKTPIKEEPSGDDKSEAEAEALIQDYMSYFETLEYDYKQLVETYMGKFRGLMDVEDTDYQESMAKEYLDQLGDAENESDNRVYKALYDMQNDLEALSYPVDIVEEIRTRYHETKNRVSQEHEAVLRKWYNKVHDTKE